jgi:hypothetical protein
MFKHAKHLVVLALAACLLASCASLVGPRDIDIPLSKLQAGLDRRFPMERRALELFDVSLSRPQLSIAPDTGRMSLSLDALVAPPFTRKSWRGNLVLSGRLYVDAARGAVFMGEPKVERFTVDGIDESRQHQLTRVANILMDNVVNELALYNFRMEDLRYGGVQFVPTRLVTTPNGLLISVEPAR